MLRSAPLLLLAGLLVLAAAPTLAGDLDLPAAATTTTEATLPCPGFQMVPHQGPSCPLEGGGWRVLLANGQSVTTHGPDYGVAANVDEASGGGKGGGGGGGTPPPSTAPVCVTDPDARFHNLLVYAVARDRPNRSAQVAPQLRAMVNESNAALRQEAAELNATRDYKFRCDAPGLVTLATARLDVEDANATFAEIVNGLQAKGFTSPYAKHWVWYDGVKASVLGQAYIRYDDRLTSGNGNARGNDFAITYGVFDWVVMMHESGHNLGAVQRSAPHSTYGGHCTDGKDIMCYDDGGGWNYTESACTDRKRFDCNHDDYFHPNPPPGHYLRDHWNVGHPYNRFIAHGQPNAAPSVRMIDCIPSIADVDEPITCYVTVDDDSDGLAHHVSHDGAPATRWPATGWARAGEYARIPVTHATVGNHTVTITPFDDANATGAPLTGIARVGCSATRWGSILGSAGGLDVENVTAEWQDALPRACAAAGGNYVLQGNLASADFDLCWHGAAGPLRCDRNPGNEQGTIPVGATAARIILSKGANANYSLYLMP